MSPMRFFDSALHNKTQAEGTELNDERTDLSDLLTLTSCTLFGICKIFSYSLQRLVNRPVVVSRHFVEL